MYLTRLILRNFRNYAQLDLSFSPEVNLIIGGNGQGKTNLLEAIYLVSTGRSFRTRRLSDLVQTGARFFYVEAHFIKDGITQSLKIYYDELSRKVQYNNTAYTTFTSLLGILPNVLLCPDDHSLISGTPADRRRFLDLHIAQIDPLYIHHLGRYFRAMKQRNHLLRLRNETTLSAWEEAMAQSGSYLIQKRIEIIQVLQPLISQWMEKLSLGKDALSVDYHSPFHLKNLNAPFISSSLMAQWHKNRHKEFHLGSTFTGPHRDDLTIEISERQAKHFSSEGQKRCTAAALRLAEWQHFKQAVGSPPLMGIDDFGIQLDSERQSLLHEQMSHLGQVFLTSPVPLETPHQTMTVHAGSIIGTL
jgi:DNA replication and repair protein RecF